LLNAKSGVRIATGGGPERAGSRKATRPKLGLPP
jgi:hypothetical protein